MTIGQRAAAEIREHAFRKHIKLGQEIANIKGNRNCYRLWKIGRVDPQAFALQQMALAGYDIHWILTGEERYG